MFGCELHSNRSSGAFWRYAYDGHDFIEFNKEIPAWVALDPAALNTKKKWEAEPAYVQRAKAYLEEECPGMLRRYLNHSRTHLDQQGTPHFPWLLPSPELRKEGVSGLEHRTTSQPAAICTGSPSSPGSYLPGFITSLGRGEH